MLEISVIGPWMADISVPGSAPKKKRIGRFLAAGEKNLSSPLQIICQRLSSSLPFLHGLLAGVVGMLRKASRRQINRLSIGMLGVRPKAPDWIAAVAFLRHKPFRQEGNFRLRPAAKCCHQNQIKARLILYSLKPRQLRGIPDLQPLIENILLSHPY